MLGFFVVVILGDGLDCFVEFFKVVEDVEVVDIECRK